ncbi:PucR family transcriptional regulator [Lysinibacillus sphaericus]|uniref:PucR family transcriptional regulator n=1 Tax=Lysinibacillus sphaericus TaxID=1421 RepID=UPI0025A129DF|nr:PucR family transcriptional regulator [Lysinibacillus sphaericus]MDM5353475.1 PucR family transcriptional regulator [Lysinibacillus sphaericus]
MNVENFLQLPITKDFIVVAGHSGLHKAVHNVEILDFEFSPDIHHVRDTIFTPNSVVLSSLLFAKQKPEYLLNAVKSLIELGASALAYKPVIYKDLPEEVITYAEEQNFPILRFGGDEFFEKIILETMAYAKTQDYSFFLETIVRRLMEEDLAPEELKSIFQQIERPFDKYVFVANLRGEGLSRSDWRQNFLSMEPLLNTGLICSYKQSLFMIITHPSQQFQVERFIHEWLTLNTIPAEAFTFGYSNWYDTQTGISIALQEAYFASVFAEIEKVSSCHYKSLASDRLLIELYRKDPTFAMDYVSSFLAPLLDDKADPDLLETAKTYITKKGNIKEVAVAHYCHPNTIRYRMAKIRQLVVPVENDYVFYERLAAAVKLYLLHSKLSDE